MRKHILRIASVCLTLALLPLTLLLAVPTRALAADSVPFIVNGTYQQSSARSMLQSINSWRANTSDNWHLNPSGQRVYPGRLAGLTYDYELEQIAMQRAAEISLNFDHTRPDGSSCFVGLNAGENIAFGSSFFMGPDMAFMLWQETDQDYEGQGHRRNMLASDFTTVGIACFVANGNCYWVQEFGRRSGSLSATQANNSAASVRTWVDSSGLGPISLSADPSSLLIEPGGSRDFPTPSCATTWNGHAGTLEPNSMYFSVPDSSVVSLDFTNGKVKAVREGKTTLTGTATIGGRQYRVSVPVTVATKQPMYRLYNPNSGEHFYTAYEKERDHLTSLGWRYEGIGWTAPATGDPVYRLYNPNAGDHHYTKSASERDHLISVGWNYEGIGWRSGGSTPLYRQYNPNAVAGAHNYTTNKAENDHLVSVGWRAEGIGWYGVS